MIKGWKLVEGGYWKSRRFWENRDGYGTVAVHRIERYFPDQKNVGHYTIVIKTRKHEKVVVKKTQKKAFRFAREWMEKHPKG